MKTVMIHALHGKGFDPVQGSVDIKDLEKLIDKSGTNLRYSFDDRLLSQELAVELLDKKGIKGWFFVVHHNVMEQDRQTRERMPDFHTWFIGECQKRVENFLSQYSFYTYQDRLYRFIRDEQGQGLHESIMSPLRQPIELLDIDKIKHHNVGLHSYSHPNRMAELSEDEQLREYMNNQDWLIHNYDIMATSMSHPMGDYSKVTLGVLDMLCIEIGFRADTLMVRNRTNLELPRIDIKQLIQEL